MRKIKLFALLAGLILSVGTMFADPIASGTCGKNGDNLTWEITNHSLLSIPDYWLTISGTGAMGDYSSGGSGMPWKDYKDVIRKVVIEEGVTTIGNFAFTGCNGLLNELILPEGLTSIGDNAFQNCTKIGSLPEGIVFPASLTTIGQAAFDYCLTLKAVTFTTPSSLTTIENSAFRSCASLETIVIPEGVTSIGMSAFHTCINLKSLTLPSTLTDLDKFFINGCSKIETVVMNATTPPDLTDTDENDDPYTGVNENLKIKCPAGAVNAYANAQSWIKYWDFLYNASTNEHAPVPAGSGNCGKYGNNVTWSFEMVGSGNHLANYEGTLTLSGEGKMDDYNLWDGGPFTPWYYNYTPFIHHIDVKEGITHIAGTTFLNTHHVKTYALPSTLTYIGPDAFWGCDNPKAEVYINANPDHLTWWDNDEGLGLDPDDFLWWVPTPVGQADIFNVMATKCYVPLGYFKKYVLKWNKKYDYEKTNVNVLFAYGLNDYNDAGGINSCLTELDGEEAPVFTLTRPLNRDGYFATLCLPFNMSAEQIALSSLANAEIKEFTGATVNGDNIHLEFTPVTEIVAGTPYFVKFTGEVMGDALDRLDFMKVTINKTAPTSITFNGITMHGTYIPKAVEAQSGIYDGVFFLGPNNTFNWPDRDGNIKPFRAYFTISGGPSGAPRRGMAVKIVEKENAPTAVENINSNEVKFNKTIENGMLIIEKNGVRYNAQGQIVK